MDHSATQPVLVLREGVEVDAARVVHPSQPQHQLQSCHPMDGGEGQAVLRTQPRMAIVPWDLGGCCLPTVVVPSGYVKIAIENGHL